jgi:monoamine oxidase
LARVGQAGGFGATFAMMRALDWLPDTAARPLDLAPGTGSGVKVAILGAGIAGLVSACEMRRAGFTVCKEFE